MRQMYRCEVTINRVLPGRFLKNALMKSTFEPNPVKMGVLG